MPEGAPLASRRISKTENGRRSSGSKPCAGLTITNWPGSAAAGNLRRLECEDVVVGREPPVGEDRARSTSIRQMHALGKSTSAYDATVRYLRMLLNRSSPGALAAAYLTVLVLQLNPACRCASAASVARRDVRRCFYGVHLAVRRSTRSSSIAHCFAATRSRPGG